MLLDTATWKPGDDPTTHPLWEEQVTLEQHMHSQGVERYRYLVNRATDKGQLSRLTSHRRLIKSWLPDIVQGIKDFIRDAKLHQNHVGGAIPISVKYLDETDHLVAAYLTLRHVLDNISSNRRASILKTARDIGSAIEHEHRMKAWERRDPALYRGVQRSLKRRKATTVHRRRVNINRFNALMKKKLRWREWPLEHRTHIGIDLIDVLVRYTKQFNVVADPSFSSSPKAAWKRPPLVLEATPELIEWLTKANDRAEVMRPVYLPTLMPPRRWDGVRMGAYYTEYVRTPHLIRFKAHQENQQRGAADEYDTLDMPLVYKALNAIQEVPWRVNERVLDIAIQAWERDLGIADLPLQNPAPLPHPRAADAPSSPYDPSAKEWKDWHATPKAIRWKKTEAGTKWKRDVSIAYAERHRGLASVLATDRTISVARRFRGKPFYFPHMLDFRGRMYPIPVDLQPQGRDLARGILTFAEGRPVSREDGSAGWLAIHLANCMGIDKVSFDERIAWVEERDALWREIAKDPLKRLDWTQEKKSAWQALAAIFEWVNYLEHGDGYISSLPIRVDGTCNGIQHLSALVRDEVGGAAVNLVPGERPRDIYKEVANPLANKLRGIQVSGGVQGDKAAWWLELCEDDLPRGLTKRPVMILPYGGTQDAFFRYIQDWLKEEHPELYKSGDGKELGSYCAFLKAHLWDQVKETIPSAMQVMQWIKDCAKLAAKGDQPIYWRTPSGFVVRHFYGKMKVRQVRLRINGETFKVHEQYATSKLSEEDQLRGISPNFIHSLDASANTLALCKAVDAGITSMTSIHDSFGGVAADMWDIYGIIRESFVEVHKVDMLAEFRLACQRVLADHIEFMERMEPDLAFERAGDLLPKPLEHGSLDLEKVIESDYFFA